MKLKILKKPIMLIAFPLDVVRILFVEIRRAFRNFHFVGGVKSMTSNWAREWSA